MSYNSNRWYLFLSTLPPLPFFIFFMLSIAPSFYVLSSIFPHLVVSIFFFSINLFNIIQYIQRASAISPENSIIPNTIDMALQPSREVRTVQLCGSQHLSLVVSCVLCVVCGVLCVVFITAYKISNFIKFFYKD